MMQKTYLLCTRCGECMSECSVLIDDSPSQEVGTFKSMRFAQHIELENTLIHKSYGKQIWMYSMIEVLLGLIKK